MLAFLGKPIMIVSTCIVLMASRLLSTGEVVPWEPKTFTVGSATVYVEVGYVDNYGYIIISSGDYIDVSLTGSITYTDAAGVEQDDYFTYRKDETSYCEVIRYGQGTVKFTECYITLTSVDGYLENQYIGTE